MAPLQLFIGEKFIGQIWKFVIDEQAGLLLAEIRNAEKKEVSFASINLNTGGVYFKDLQLPEKWLTSISGGSNGVLLLHGYQSAQSPVPKGIIAIDSYTGTQLWDNYTHAVRLLSVNGPIAHNTQIQPPLLYLLDPLTGKSVRPYNTATDTEAIQNILLPQILDKAPPHFNAFFEDETIGNCHYMEHNSFRIVSLHFVKNGLLQQALFITQNETLVYRDILNSQIQKLQPEAFIIYQDQLVYIKNTSELKIINL